MQLMNDKYVLGYYWGSLCLMVDDLGEEAVSCYTRLLELDPVSSLVHFGLGKKALQDKKYEDAINSFGLG